MGTNQSTQILSSRAIQGMFWEEIGRLAADQANLTNRLSLEATSDQASEEYAWLGQVPKMSEWIGTRQLEKLRAANLIIKNVHFEASLNLAVKDLRRDKTPQIRTRISDLAESASQHMYELLVSLMNNGAATVCYDGDFFFDTDHDEGDSGNQSNDLALSATDAALPTQAEMAGLIIELLEALYGFKDDRGRAMNRTARSFVVVVPVTYWGTAQAAVSNQILGAASGASVSSPLQSMPVQIEVVAEPDATAQTIQLFRTDGRMKPFIAQTEQGTMQLKSKAEGSEYEFDTDHHAHGVDVWHNAGYGLWQFAVLGTVT